MIPFIDLKAQYRENEQSINRRIQSVLEHGQYIMGPEVKELEVELANYLGVKHAIGVSDGTTALQIALMASNLNYGDEVLVPVFTYFATAEVVSLLGLKPVFIDVDEKTANINVDLIEDSISEKTKAIIPVSLYGQCADMDEINGLAKKYNLMVIEDAAQSFGASYKNNKSGNLTDIACTSFFPSKPLGCYGDGGAIFTNNDNLAKVIKEIRSHGQEKRYYHTRIGLNGRLDTLQAAILIEKLKIFDNELNSRQKVAELYNSNLKENVQPFIPKNDNKSAYAQYTIRVKNRDKVQSDLMKRGVPTAVHYPIPIHHQPVYQTSESFPIAEMLSREVLSLPMSPYLKEEDQYLVINAINDIC